MRDDEIAIYSVGVILLIILGGMVFLGWLQERQQEQEFERAYAQGCKNCDRVARLLAESEAAAIARQHQQRLTEKQH